MHTQRDTYVAQNRILQVGVSYVFYPVVDLEAQDWTGWPCCLASSPTSPHNNWYTVDFITSFLPSTILIILVVVFASFISYDLNLIFLQTEFNPVRVV